MSTTPWQTSLFIGFTIGTTDAYINHPLWALKTRQQAGMPFTLNPRILYRGVVSHALSSVPMDMLQVTVSRVAMERLLPKDTSYTTRRLLGGLIGGTAAALISSPAELVMTCQQQGFNPITALKAHPFKGFLSAAGRDSLFCCGFFAAVPLVREALEEKDVSSSLAATVAGLSSGVFTAVISHPCDTLKTLIQSSKEKKTYKDAFKEAMQIHGWKGLFTGLPLRTARVASGIFILGTMNDFLERTLIHTGN